MTVLMTFNKLPFSVELHETGEATEEEVLGAILKSIERYVADPSGLVTDAQIIASRVVENSKPQPGLSVPSAAGAVQIPPTSCLLHSIR